jgi:ABC-type antimicrobial peptide transport system permease subunit
LLIADWLGDLRSRVRLLRRAPGVSVTAVCTFALALGAQSRDILRLVFSEGVWMTGVGTLAGLALAAGASRVLGGLLFGVERADGITLVAIAVLLFVVGLIAMLVPARRTIRIEPASALRQD